MFDVGYGFDTIEIKGARRCSHKLRYCKCSFFSYCILIFFSPWNYPSVSKKTKVYEIPCRDSHQTYIGDNKQKDKQTKRRTSKCSTMRRTIIFTGATWVTPHTIDFDSTNDIDIEHRTRSKMRETRIWTYEMTLEVYQPRVNQYWPKIKT